MTMRDDSPGGRLLALVRGLGVRLGRERSFRMSRGSFLADRFLLSVSAGSLGSDPAEKVMWVCRELRLPAEAAEAVRCALPAAKFIHFGFESNPPGHLFKVYLETPPEDTPAQPVVLHTAWKWTPGRNSTVLTRYIWHPALHPTQIESRMRRCISAAGVLTGGIDRPETGWSEEAPDVHPGLRGGPMPVAVPSAGEGTGGTAGNWQLATGDFLAILRKASGRTTSIRYVEVVEESSPRRSFDLNLYDSELAISDIIGEIAQACRAFGIDPAECYAHCEPHLEARLGHVAGGLHRAGEPFLTVYYGAEELP